MIASSNEQLRWLFEESERRIRLFWDNLNEGMQVNRQSFRSNAGLLGVIVSSPGKDTFSIVYGDEIAELVSDTKRPRELLV